MNLNICNFAIIRYVCSLFLFLIAVQPIQAISISEKKARLTESEAPEKMTDLSLETIAKKLKEKRKELLQLYVEANDLYLHRSDDTDANVKQHATIIKKAKRELDRLEREWRDVSQEMISKEDEALWHQPDTTVGQLVVDYGSTDCIYLIPPEIASLRVHVSSELSIPRTSWQEILELTLSSYGVGIKQLSPFLKQLYFLRLNQTGLAIITDKRSDIELLPYDAKIAFVFTPRPHEMKRTYQFLERFIPQEQVTLQIVGGNLIAVGLVKEIFELLKVYDFIAAPQQAQEWRLVALQKAHSEEMIKILVALFGGDGGTISTAMPSGQDMKMPYSPSQEGGTNFRVMPLKYPGNSLFLIGKREQIEKASEIIQDIESKIGQVQEKTIQWYACKHSDADELAKVLSQVYMKLTQVMSKDGGSAHAAREKAVADASPTVSADRSPSYTLDNAPLVVSPSPLIVTDHTKKKHDVVHENFIVDQKTNAIVMIVESYLLPKLKELLKKLDVPKKMIQIDVLLVEKSITDSDQFGLNLLKLADAVTQPHHTTRLLWNDITGDTVANRGILQFSMARGKQKGFPKYDLSYKFLLSQSGIHINANPSVTTVNQTPAKIALVDEISINTGVVEVDTTNTTRLKDSFPRAQYGIIIQVTPTVHAKSENDDAEDEVKFITLETDVNFDTIKPSADSRPVVARRNIKNEIRIADGETVIIGGLRRKQSQNDRDSVPFLGEIPGLGKLFSTTALSEGTTEMFIFITPRIVPDPKEEFHALRLKDLKKRPGDIPEFLQEVESAKDDERNQLFYKSMKLLTSGV